MRINAGITDNSNPGGARLNGIALTVRRITWVAVLEMTTQGISEVNKRLLGLAEISEFALNEIVKIVGNGAVVTGGVRLTKLKGVLPLGNGPKNGVGMDGVVGVVPPGGV